MPETQVLIVGAGPTGLLLALSFVRSGVRVRIVDKAAARTLRVFRLERVSTES